MSNEIEEVIEDMQETDVPDERFEAPRHSRTISPTLYVSKKASMGTSKIEVPKRTSDTVMW